MGSARVAGDGAMRGLLSVCLSFFLFGALIWVHGRSGY